MKTADPRVREDGCCAHCGGPRRITAQARKYAGYQIDADPFCSARCARAWHGCPLDNEGTELQHRGGVMAADEYRNSRRYAA